jgi:hypothetical protein
VASFRHAAATDPAAFENPPISAKPAHALKLQRCAASSASAFRCREQAVAWPTLEALLGHAFGGDAATAPSTAARWCDSLRALDVRTVSELRVCAQAFLEDALGASPAELGRLKRALEAEQARNGGSDKSFAVYEVRDRRKRVCVCERERER